MNIREALYLPVKREGLIIGPDEFDCKHRYRTLDGEEVVTSFKAKRKEDLLDLQKPEIPQFVADWIETVKSLGLDLYELLEGPADNSLEEWIINEDNQELIVKARLFGYTVEKEKLYKVKDKRFHPDRNYLNFDKCSEYWFFSNGVDTYSFTVKHTRQKLEEAGFNVFDDDNYEVIEVTE